jgi:3-oxoacyl-[acyl-carrier protein] reductase
MPSVPDPVPLALAVAGRGNGESGRLAATPSAPLPAAAGGGPKLVNKVAIVTGGGRGIGRDIALRFAQEGACVVVADLDDANGRGVVAEIEAGGGLALAVKADIADPLQVEALMGATTRRFGRLDVLVNNAGVGLARPFLTTTLADFERVLRVNLVGTFLCGQAAARVMVRQKSGTIVNIASISGQRGATARSAYGAAKAGVIQLTKVMALELARYGIRVNAIAPGPVDTAQSRQNHTAATRQAYHERILLKRYGTGAENAAAVLFLACDESSFITGEILNVDGGFNAAGLIFEQ